MLQNTRILNDSWLDILYRDSFNGLLASEIGLVGKLQRGEHRVLDASELLNDAHDLAGVAKFIVVPHIEVHLERRVNNVLILKIAKLISPPAPSLVHLFRSLRDTYIVTAHRG